MSLTDNVEQLPEVRPSRRRTRERRSRIRVNKENIVERVLKFESDDRTRRSDDIEARLQRYAKYRLWTEGKDWPWEDSSDAAIPDMMTGSLRMQDTLHNAVMSHSPPIGAKAWQSSDKEKEAIIDRLQEHQMFVEQPGEQIIGDLIEQFINDGVFTAFIPWVKEKREVSDAIIFDPIPAELEPADYFNALVRRHHPNMVAVPTNQRDGWDWRVTGEGDEKIDISFYTTDDNRVEMVTQQDVTVYDGPRVIPKDYEHVLYPPRSANLQIPSPSNPGGAPHVILVDFPTVDEVRRLQKSGFYDLATKEDMDALKGKSRSTDYQDREQQKDTFAGQEGSTEQRVEDAQNTVTRLMCFDIYDVDGDGRAEDVVWWVIKETKTLLRAKHLTEVNPSSPPRRPFAESAFLPVAGRREGIGFLELVEGLHDLQKQIVDQSIDAGTLANAPFGFYRQHGSMRPEGLRLSPGEMYPVGDPQRDIQFPTFGNRDQTFGLNMVTLLGAMEERLTMVGDIQLGRVPAGKSSALRTVGGMALLSGQGEARPERILRRFFMGLTEIWAQIHELNQRFLPDEKKFRIAGVLKEGEDPFMDIQGRQSVAGRFRFDFSANVLNTSKTALQQSLMQMGQVYISQLSLQLGIIDADGIYRWMRDVGRSFGQDPDQYLKAPSPDSLLPRMFAEEALTEILHYSVPEGQPAEAGGWVEHQQKLMEFVQGDQFGVLDERQVNLFKIYMEKVVERAALQQRQMQIAQAAQGMQQSLGGGGQGGRPAEGPPPSTESPPVQGGELLDESLPGAGGGGEIA